MPRVTASIPRLLVCAGALAAAGAAPPEQPPVTSATTILLTRHAEKESGPNPDLQPEGLERAGALAEIAADAGVAAVYSTGFCRTAQTAQPTARRLGISLRVAPVAPHGASLEGCRPPVDVAHELLPDEPVALAAQRLLAAHRGSAALVVGHSNTVPEWIAALGGELPCPDPFPLTSDGACWLPDGDFHHLFVVTVSAAGAVEVERRAYGRVPAG